MPGTALMHDEPHLSAATTLNYNACNAFAAIAYRDFPLLATNNYRFSPTSTETDNLLGRVA
jgi:hypothetical protein